MKSEEAVEKKEVLKNASLYTYKRFTLIERLRLRFGIVLNQRYCPECGKEMRVGYLDVMLPRNSVWVCTDLHVEEA